MKPVLMELQLEPIVPCLLHVCPCEVTFCLFFNCPLSTKNL